MSTRALALLLLALMLGTGIAYAPVVHNEFVLLDDHGYLFEDPRVRDGLTLDNIAWAFTTRAMSNWHPLTWLSYLLDASLFGLDPVAFHVENVALHALAGVLLCLALLRMRLHPVVAGGAAAVFLLHPIHVESVAWASERKDVLTAVAFSALLLVWTRYAERPSVGRYAAAFVVFTLGLLAKPSFVSVPFALLLVDVWPLRRTASTSLARLLLEKLPLVALAVGMSVVTLLAQTDAIMSTLRRPMSARVVNAVVSCWRYLEKLAAPRDLVAYYPFPPDGWAPGDVVLPGIGLAVLVAVAALLWTRGRREIATGLATYVLMLGPMLGIVQAGRQAMADRYAYLATILLAAAVLALLVEGAPAWRRRAVGAVCVVASLLWIGLSREQVRTWRTTGDLFAHALSHTEGNAWIHAAAADLALREGRIDEAVAHAEAANAIEPGVATFIERWSQALLAAGREGEALVVVDRAIGSAPPRGSLHRTRARALAALGASELARDEFLRAIDLDVTRPADAFSDIGVLWVRDGRVADALGPLETAALLEPKEAKHRDRLEKAMAMLR